MGSCFPQAPLTTSTSKCKSLQPGSLWGPEPQLHSVSLAALLAGIFKALSRRDQTMFSRGGRIKSLLPAEQVPEEGYADPFPLEPLQAPVLTGKGPVKGALAIAEVSPRRWLSRLPLPHAHCPPSRRTSPLAA